MTESRLLIGDRHLGNILYSKDKLGRGYLKLSIKNKIAGFVVATDIPTNMPAQLKLEEPVKIELSYKFDGDIFSVKKIFDDGKILYEFHPVPVPHKNSLFFLRIKDWHKLGDGTGKEGALVLDPPADTADVAMVFSFLGEDGHPLKPHQYSNLIMRTIQVPETPLDTFCIGIAADPDNQSTNSINIVFPYPLMPAGPEVEPD